MTAKEWVFNSFSVGLAVLVALLTIPILFLFACTALLGALVYVPAYAWITIRQSIRVKPEQIA